MIILTDAVTDILSNCYKASQVYTDSHVVTCYTRYHTLVLDNLSLSHNYSWLHWHCYTINCSYTTR